MKRFMAAREPEEVLRQYQRILAMQRESKTVVKGCVTWLQLNGATMAPWSFPHAAESATRLTSPTIATW